MESFEGYLKKAKATAGLVMCKFKGSSSIVKEGLARALISANSKAQRKMKLRILK